MSAPRHRSSRPVAVAVVLVLALVAAGCSSADDTRPRASSTTTATGEPPATDPTAPGEPGEPPPTLVLSPEGGGLDAYEAVPPFRSVALLPPGPDAAPAVNGQVCLFPDATRRFVTGASDAAGGPEATGWGIFRLEGTGLDDLTVEEQSRLVPTYQPSADPPTPAGCGFLSDGRLVTTDIGNRAGGEPTGQLTLWLPPYDGEAVATCKLDTAVGTALSLWVDDQDRIYVASARGPSIGVWRYSGPYPTGADAAGGCGGTDAVGSPVADRTRKELFIPADAALATPSGVTGGPGGSLFVSSVTTGVINEYDANGTFVRTVLQPAAGAAPGSPLGLVFDPAGALFYADLGLGPTGTGPPAPAVGAGSVRRIVFADGTPLPPEAVAEGLDRPDGLGLVVPSPEGGAASRV